MDLGPVSRRFRETGSGFRTQKAIAKDQTLWLQSIFIRVSLMGTEVPFIQEVLGVYTCPFLDTDELEMALRARNVSRAFEKQAPGLSMLQSGNYRNIVFIVNISKIYNQLT